ncbi:MAG: hypothetical protein ACR2NP_20575 [Pirellulaceae bacterium]
MSAKLMIAIRVGSFAMLTLACVMLLIQNASAGLWEEESDPDLEPTHKQTHTIRPEIDGESAKLHTFCLSDDGHILASVAHQGKTALQVYTADGELTKQFDLPFAATAIGQAPDGTVFIGGSGQLARFSLDASEIVPVDAPNLADREALEKEAQEAAEKQKAQITAQYDQQVERIEQRIERHLEIPEDERNERFERRLATMQEQKQRIKEAAEETLESLGSMIDVDSLIAQRMGIQSIAANSQDLFICCRGANYSYEVWRADHQLQNAEKIMDGLRGCCGQCDFQASEEHLIFANNCGFSVDFYDRDGEKVSSFGEKGGDTGFGGCCNPMNVRCCENGDILTAESSIGWIKRFNAEGELVGIIGKAKIGGGCKHVPIGHDAQRDRFYMMYEDDSSICVLVPLAEAPEFTADELEAKEAMEGLGQQLIGEWSVDGEPSSRHVNPETSQQTVPSGFEFAADGDLKMFESVFARGENAWRAVKQDLDDKTLLVEHVQREASTFQFQIAFQSEDEIKLTMLYGEHEYGSQDLKRVIASDDAGER